MLCLAVATRPVPGAAHVRDGQAASRKLRPSNSAETCAGDILITPSCALSQKNVTPSIKPLGPSHFTYS